MRVLYRAVIYLLQAQYDRIRLDEPHSAPDIQQMDMIEEWMRQLEEEL